MDYRYKQLAINKKNLGNKKMFPSNQQHTEGFTTGQVIGSNEDNDDYFNDRPEVRTETIPSTPSRIRLVDEKQRNEIERQMDSLYEEIEIVDDESSESIGKTERLDSQQDLSPIKSEDVLSTLHRTPSEQILKSSLLGDGALNGKSNSSPNLSMQKETLDQLRYMQAMNFGQNFASIVNDPFEVGCDCEDIKL